MRNSVENPVELFIKLSVQNFANFSSFSRNKVNNDGFDHGLL